MELNKPFSCRQPNILKVVVFIFSLITFLSCKEEPLKVGQNILPEEENFGVGIDTLAVNLHTLDMEPVYTRDRGISPLGSVNDPLFGVITGEFVTDFTFYSGVEFRAGLDSIGYVNLELVVRFSSTYADNSEINFKVYKLYESIPDYSYSDFKLEPGMYDPVELNIGNPEPEYGTELDTSGVEIPTDEIIGYRVFLSDEFGKDFLDPDLITDSAYYYDSIFRSYFHGFYFEVEDRTGEGGGLISLSHIDSRLILRTSDTLKSGVIDTVENEFVLAYPDLGGTSINMYRSNFSSIINSVLNDTNDDHNVAYIQSLVGPKILVSIPELFAKRREYNYKVSVSKAELVLPIDSSTYDKNIYKAPQYLGIRDVMNDTNIIDDGLLPLYFGGILDTINYEYRFNIGNFIHYFLRDSISFTDERLYLFGARYLTITGYPTDITYFSLTTPGRVVLNSINSGKQPLLRIIYSELP
jgi:hypothetical protein